MVAALNDKALQNVGDAQGYTIFEWARESLAELISKNEPPVPLSLHLDSGDEDKETSGGTAQVTSLEFNG